MTHQALKTAPQLQVQCAFVGDGRRCVYLQQIAIQRCCVRVQFAKPFPESSSAEYAAASHVVNAKILAGHYRTDIHPMGWRTGVLRQLGAPPFPILRRLAETTGKGLDELWVPLHAGTCVGDFSDRRFAINDAEPPAVIWPQHLLAQRVVPTSGFCAGKYSIPWNALAQMKRIWLSVLPWRINKAVCGEIAGYEGWH